MIKNICMILLIFVLLGACGSQAAEREKHEEPGNRIGCQMLYVDKKVRAQEVEKFIIESQKNIAAIRQRCFLIIFLINEYSV